jgi:hypothetical protein
VVPVPSDIALATAANPGDRLKTAGNSGGREVVEAARLL